MLNEQTATNYVNRIKQELNFLSKEAYGDCEIHRIPNIVYQGDNVCPQCKLEEINREENKAFQRKLNEQEKQKKLNMLERHSVVNDKTLLRATLENFVVDSEETKRNKALAFDLSAQMIEGVQMNVWIQSSETGVGKSHLAMGILKQVNDLERSCLFVDTDTMFRKIFDSFKNEDSKYTEEYFVKLCTEADFLVLDDIGAEVGNVSTRKQASDYVSKVLRAIMNGRQDKCTVMTTNLSSEALKAIYDKKLISRMNKLAKGIVFKETKDKRMIDLGF